jgi:Zn-finger nucleic acid-binding protein
VERSIGLNCENCGAPLKLVPGRDYFFCEHCGSFHFPDANRDGVRQLGEASNMACPVCREDLVTGSVEEVRVLTCPKCRGILVAQWNLYTIVRYMRSEFVEQDLPPQPLNRPELERAIACPSCGQRMDTHPYYGPGNVVIDNCARCGLVWLDFGELHRILGAAGRDRGYLL